MPRTIWANKASSVPSDRIRPSTQPAQNQPKNKGKSRTKEPPKSKALRKLESFLESIRNSSGREKDPAQGCFCQARSHDLSSYNPICRYCGLILCLLNLPNFACPHCGSDLFTPSTKSSLVSRLEEEIAETITKEEGEREKVVEEARKAVGAFPALSGATTPGGSPLNVHMPRPSSQTHKVMSLNSKTKKVIVSSYTSTPVTSRPVSRAEEEEEEPERVPAPPPVPSYTMKRPPNQPWQNMRAVPAQYIPPPADKTVQGDAATGTEGSSRRRRQKKCVRSREETSKAEA